MSSNSTDRCEPGDNLCVVRLHQQEVIIVPTLLLLAFVVIMFTICLLRVCAPRRRAVTPRPPAQPRGPSHQRSRRPGRGRDLQGIDAPAQFDVMEHEEVPMAPRGAGTGGARPPRSTEWQHEAFSQLVPLPQGFSIQPSNTWRYRAQLGGTPVVLRVLRDTADSSEKEDFLGFTSFLSGLGPHPFLPALVGVVSVAPPLMMVVEELQHRDLLDFLWRCRQGGSSAGIPCELTEKRIFTMAEQVASALDFLHGRSCIHGNVGARSVLIGGDLTAKLWGLGPAYRRARRPASTWAQEDTEMRKWQAPEVLAMRGVTQSSDMWSFGVLLFEMVTLGDAPFAEVPPGELLPQLQRGRTLRRPAHCSSALFSLITSCCQFSPQQRTSLALLIRKLRSGEGAASGHVLRVAEPIDIEKYLQEAGYGEANNYAVL